MTDENDIIKNNQMSKMTDGDNQVVMIVKGRVWLSKYPTPFTECEIE